jgi:hypothetical protein
MLKLIIIYFIITNVSCKKMNLFNHTSKEDVEEFNRIKDSSYKDEDELLKILFQTYNPNIIPRRNLNESLKLYVGLAMIQLVNMVNIN